MESTPPLAGMALAVTSQDWTSLGLGDDPNIAATMDFDATVERLTSLLLIRIVAIVAPDGKYPDLSTTTICRAALMENAPWPAPITTPVIEQLRAYVSAILKTYATQDHTPYHSQSHCYHVTISMNKMLDLMLNTDIQGNRLHPTFGLRSDPLMHLVLIFSALIHDAEHRGIPNRQLVLEDDPLAVLYNDQSIAENRSLFLGFSILLKPEYRDLRNAMFLSKDEYRRFRKASVNLILTTDIASPERTQVGKSKWKEAFGDPFETVERKVRNEIKRRQSIASSAASPAVLKLGRRTSATSMYSELTTELQEGGRHPNDDDDEVSPSITPDSSYNGDDYDSIGDDDYSQDGMIVSSKPFSNVVSSSHLNLYSNNKQPLQLQRVEPAVGNINKTPLGAAQLGYEPDISNNDLGYGDTPGNGNNNGNSNSKEKGSSVSVGGNTGTQTHNSNLNGGGGTATTTATPSQSLRSPSASVKGIRTKKALPNPMASLRNHTTSDSFKREAVRNMSMSDFKRDSKNDDLNHCSEHVQNHTMSKQMAKFQRRFSTSVVNQGNTHNSKKYKYRLGILRAVDLSGEAIETYSRGSATGAVSTASLRTPSVRSPTVVGSVADEVDELKVTVVMEQMMTACDVAHNLQSWEHMVKWSNQLFLELKKAHKEGRGGDPKNNWFENQIGFLESYLLPLARRLEDTGVFGDVIGPVFARIVEANRDRWLTDGLGVTTDIILEGGRKFPVEGDVTS